VKWILLATVVFTNECGMTLDYCSKLCGMRPIKSLDGVSCVCEDFTPCYYIPPQQLEAK